MACDVNPNINYNYEPLQNVSSTIRLVHVEAQHIALGNLPGVPRCSIRHHPFESQARYTALSYAWGDANDTKPILLNGRRKEVTNNLWQFLSQTARDLRDERIETQALWIDAICINQDDNLEKSSQVAMMGQIYKMASKLVIWLGPASHDSHHAFDFLMFMAGDRSDRAVIRRICKNKDETITALVSLLERSWWKRLWVQQEVALTDFAKTELVCGRSRMSWRKVTIAHYEIDSFLIHRSAEKYYLGYWDRKDPATPGKEYELLTSMAWCWSRMRQTCRNSDSFGSVSSEGKLTLANRLSVNASDPHHRLDASNPLDYVYSLVSICSDLDDVRWRPNYSRSKEDLYFQVAQYLLHSRGPFALGLCSHPLSDADGLPSWVLDLSKRLLGQPLLEEPKDKHIFSSPFSFQAKFSYEINGRELLLNAAKVDSIQKISQFHGDVGVQPFTKAGVEQMADEWLLAYVRYLDSMNSKTIEDFADAWWRIPICNQRPRFSHERKEQKWKQHFNDLVEHARRDFSGHLNMDTIGYRELMSKLTPGRKPFFTTDNMVGLGPVGIKPGDELFVLLGSEVPLVLRSIGDSRYRLIGEAYVYNFDCKSFLEGSAQTRRIHVI